MSDPTTPATLVTALETKIADNLPPTQIVREIQAIVDQYKTTLVPTESVVLKVLDGVLSAFGDHCVATIDGRQLILEDCYLDSHRITLLLKDTTLGTSYESTISLDCIETEAS